MVLGSRGVVGPHRVLLGFWVLQESCVLLSILGPGRVLHSPRVLGPDRVLGLQRVLGPHRVLAPHRILGPPWVLGPHRILGSLMVLSPHRVQGPKSRFSGVPVFRAVK